MEADFLALAELELGVRVCRQATQSQWQPWAWRVDCLFEPSQANVDTDNTLHFTCRIAIYQDELQGYYLNLDTDQPCVFFLFRHPNEDRALAPHIEKATVSYDEAARWMDAGEEVQNYPMPESFKPWLAELVDARYKPEPKRRKRPQSFLSPDKRQ